MSDRNKFLDFIKPVLDMHRCRLVDLTIKGEKYGRVLRILIELTKQKNTIHEGIDHKLCSLVSQDISAILDVEDFPDYPYTLEVSSPGTDRPLFTLDDFKRFCGKRAKVKLGKKIKGQKLFNGLIAGVNDADVLIKEKKGQIKNIPINLISTAKLNPRFEELITGNGD